MQGVAEKFMARLTPNFEGKSKSIIENELKVIFEGIEHASLKAHLQENFEKYFKALLEALHPEARVASGDGFANASHLAPADRLVALKLDSSEILTPAGKKCFATEPPLSIHRACCWLELLSVRFNSILSDDFDGVELTSELSCASGYFDALCMVVLAKKAEIEPELAQTIGSCLGRLLLLGLRATDNFAFSSSWPNFSRVCGVLAAVLEPHRLAKWSCLVQVVERFAASVEKRIPAVEMQGLCSQMFSFLLLRPDLSGLSPLECLSLFSAARGLDLALLALFPSSRASCSRADCSAFFMQLSTTPAPPLLKQWCRALRDAGCLPAAADGLVALILADSAEAGLFSALLSKGEDETEKSLLFDASAALLRAVRAASAELEKPARAERGSDVMEEGEEEEEEEESEEGEGMDQAPFFTIDKAGRAAQ